MGFSFYWFTKEEVIGILSYKTSDHDTFPFFQSFYPTAVQIQKPQRLAVQSSSNRISLVKSINVGTPRELRNVENGIFGLSAVVREEAKAVPPCGVRGRAVVAF